MRVLPHFGFHWDRTAIPFPAVAEPHLARSLWRARKLFAEIVHDITALEGNPFTYPEVQTLLEGITVGGHKLSDADQVLNQKASLERLFALVEQGSFQLTAEVACGLQALAARGEALEEGVFRTGKVGIGGTSYQPPPASEIPGAFDRMALHAAELTDPYERGMTAFLFVARTKCFWDGNKRTGRLLMNGVLLAAGQDIISVPAKLRSAFNEKMLRFYDSADGTEMMQFLSGLQIRSRFE